MNFFLKWKQKIKKEINKNKKMICISLLTKKQTIVEIYKRKFCTQSKKH